ncbi:hypothetical protein PSP31120_01282 [Pandoraea sputorum]|nr:hypothetical protein PSP31120_01282 [Pandoraea sputorum]
MEMITVRSSAIAAVGYDPVTRHMRISFRSGGTYDFCGVPKNVYEQFMASASMGRYYHAHIENRYRC